MANKPGKTINQLLAEFGSQPVTKDELLRRVLVLEGKFYGKHGLRTWKEIQEAIRTNQIEECELVDEWIQLRAALDVMGMLPVP